jgi:hypothetical protein
LLKAVRVDPVEPSDAQRALQDLHLPHTTPQPSSPIVSPARLRLLAAAREKLKRERACGRGRWEGVTDKGKRLLRVACCEVSSLWAAEGLGGSCEPEMG